MRVTIKENLDWRITHVLVELGLILLLLWVERV